MRIVVDENIACLNDTFAGKGELITLPGRAIVANDVKGADALIVRSVTRVDEALLTGSGVKFVGSCTIGTDHVDVDYLNRAGIQFAHAPGCNARAVAEYVVTALYTVLGELSQWQSRRVGIVGFGNVGRSLAQLLDAMEISWVAFDPLIEQSLPNLVSFDEIMRCDIVSLHVPLTKTGAYATYHWFEKQLLQALAPNTLLINAARGAIIKNADLLNVIATGAPLKAALDVFENEPAIDVQLLDAIALATPHIAGYSVQGKQRGTWQVYRAFCAQFGLAADATMPSYAEVLDCQGCVTDRDVILRAYDIAGDNARLREGVGGDMATHFDALRKHYPSRQEWANRRLVNLPHSGLQITAIDRLRSVGFTV